MPGLRAPAFFVSTVLAGAALLAPLPATAQQEIPRPQARPPASSVPVPGQLELSKMLWSTIVAVDQANRSGNYSVLRDMAAQSFQIANNAATLAQAFAPFRQLQIDLSNVLLIAPTYTDAPRMVQDNVLEIKGVFQLRPTSIYFDVFYSWEQGGWKLSGIELRPVQLLDSQPAPNPPARQQPTVQQVPQEQDSGRR